MDRLNSIEVSSFSELKSELNNLINKYTITDIYIDSSLSNQKIFSPHEIKGEYNGYIFEGIYHELFSFYMEDYRDEKDNDELLLFIKSINDHEVKSVNDLVNKFEHEFMLWELVFQCEDLDLIELNWDKNTPNEIINSIDSFWDIEKYIEEDYEDFTYYFFESITIYLSFGEIDSDFKLIWKENKKK
jgi:hypothetical protein